MLEGVIPGVLHAQNRMVLPDNLFIFFPSNLRLSKGMGKWLSNTATKRPNERNAFIYKPEGGPNSFQTPMPLGEPRDDVANIGCLHKDRRTKALTKAGQVKHRQHHTGPPGS
jgi:hypothetical protein